MYVLNVIPFSRYAPPGTLSYRSRTPVEPGTLVGVTLRRKNIQAMVVECLTVAEAKATIKAADFTLSSSRPAPHGALPPALLQAARAAAAYHAVPLGTMLAALLSASVAEEMPLPFEQPFRLGDSFSYTALEALLDSRRAAYAAHIRAQRAAGVSVLFVAPTIAEVEYWRAAFEEFSPRALAGNVPAKRRPALYQAAFEPGTLVITTPAFSWIPLPALGSVILERASAGSYRMAQRPYTDMRIALRELASARRLALLFGDYPLPLEYREDPAAGLQEAPATPLEVVNVRKEKEAVQSGPWRAVPVELSHRIAETLAQDGRALVIAVRKGYAPAVVCRDCGLTLTDERGMPYTFTTTVGGVRVLRTADGLSERSAELVCPSCGSWNLLPLGIGIERVTEELREAFPGARVLEVTREVRTLKAAAAILRDAALPGTIVVGTESVLPWLLALGIPAFELGALASADSLLAVPFWRARERLVRLGLLLRRYSARMLLVTRLSDDAAIRSIAHPDAPGFFAEESQLRKALSYPPFGTLVALQAEAPRARLDALDAHVRKALGSIGYTVLPDRPITHAVMRRSFVLHLPKGAWPDAALSARLQHLPPSVRVLIDPDAF